MACLLKGHGDHFTYDFPLQFRCDGNYSIVPTTYFASDTTTHLYVHVQNIKGIWLTGIK